MVEPWDLGALGCAEESVTHVCLFLARAHVEIKPMTMLVDLSMHCDEAAKGSIDVFAMYHSECVDDHTVVQVAMAELPG